jgi:formylglycine-generating enzyme required for sulfatase activity
MGIQRVIRWGCLGIYFGLAIVGLAGLPGCKRKPPEGMALITAGKFKMGTDDLSLEDLAGEVGMGKTWVLDATPSREVDLPAFYIDRTEVTNEAYFQFVRDTGFQALPHWKSGRPSGDQVDLPVVFVNWFEAQAYCEWRGKRLPTEAEWEKAARGPNGNRYPWGNEFRKGVADVGGEFSGLRPVGSLPAGNSPEGVSDLIGNAWEWTDSLYEPYPGSDYQAPEFGRGYRVLRGNSWAELGHFPPEILEKLVAAQARASYRFYMPPNAAVEDIGFRCAKTAGK